MDRNVSFPITTGRRTLGFRDERAVRQAVFGSKDFVQRLMLDTTLDVHRGCVNTISWSETGSLILSGSDDKKLCFTDPYSRKLKASIPSGHRSNVFSAKFLPGSRDRQVVSCSGDGCIMFSDIDRPEAYAKNAFNCHYGTAYEVVTLPSDPNTFLSCGEDGTVRWFDLRIKTSCSKEDCKEDVMINCRRAVTGVSVNPILPYQLAVGCSDSSVRIFDRRMLGTKLSGNHTGRGMQGILCRFCPAHLQNKYSRPTSLSYSPSGAELLVSYASDYVYLFGTTHHDHCQASPLPLHLQGGGAEKDLEEEDEEDLEGEEPDKFPPNHPVKRLRLRGDWSDTGPRARPRSEQAEEERPRSTMVQRMTEMLSRWLEDSSSGRLPAGSSGSTTSTSTTPLTSTSPATTSTSPTTSATTPTTSTAAAAASTVKGPSSGSDNDRFRETSDRDGSKGRRELSSKGPASKIKSMAAKFAGAGESVPMARKQADRTHESEPGKGRGVVKPRDLSESSRRADESREGVGSREGVYAIDGAIKKGSGADSERQVRKGQNDVTEERDSELKGGTGRKLDAKMGAERSGEPPLSEPVFSMKAKGQRSTADSENNSSEDGVGGRRRRDSKGERRGDEGESEKMEVDYSTAEHRRKGEADRIFALGDRMEDKNPVARLTKQDSLELSRSRRASVVGDPPSLPDDHPSCSQSEAGIPCQPAETMDDGQTRGRDGGGDEVGREDDRSRARTDDDKDINENEKGEEDEMKRRKEGRTGQSLSSSSSSMQSTTERSRSASSQSMTASESDSDEEMQVMGAEREKKTPLPRDASARPKERVRSEAELRLRELFKTRKQEREREAEVIKNVYAPAVQKVYKGHRNSRTMIKEANFWGDHYIISGSDCGHIFIWDRYTTKLVMLLEGDKHVVNCIQPHPFDPILATSGIDYNVKLWAPLAEAPYFPEDSEEVMRVNELMLEETRDTITVPPSFMLRMLASLNHIRRDRRHSQDPHSASESSDD